MWMMVVRSKDAPELRKISGTRQRRPIFFPSSSSSPFIARHSVNRRKIGTGIRGISSCYTGHKPGDNSIYWSKASRLHTRMKT
ncbi:hypothetical protein WG66_005371 [Moniliophthora roreri]|nr:hypothetical protein WG66_005371 [Moniliophthora roreri]